MPSQAAWDRAGRPHRLNPTSPTPLPSPSKHMQVTVCTRVAAMGIKGFLSSSLPPFYTAWVAPQSVGSRPTSTMCCVLTRPPLALRIFKTPRQIASDLSLSGGSSSPVTCSTCSARVWSPVGATRPSQSGHWHWTKMRVDAEPSPARQGEFEDFHRMVSQRDGWHDACV